MSRTPSPRSSASRAITPLTDLTVPARRRPGRRAGARTAALAASRRETVAAAVAAGTPPVRLNKLLASRGLGARRKCDVLIEAGSVRVNGTVVREPGVRVDPGHDRIEVHGRPIPGRSALRHLMLHKPVGVITTLDDPEGRPTVKTLLPPGPRLFPVGRLDAETSGLLIVTNDGELAHQLMHPRFGVRKVYRVRVDRPADAQQIQRLRTGVEFERGVTSAPCEVRVRNARRERAEIEIALHEGRYRQVRRMCEVVGLGVKGLHRSAYGPLRIGTLPRGAWRDLTAEEVRRLRAASTLHPHRIPPRGPGKAPSVAPRVGATGPARPKPSRRPHRTPPRGPGSRPTTLPSQDRRGMGRGERRLAQPMGKSAGAAGPARPKSSRRPSRKPVARGKRPASTSRRPSRGRLPKH